MSTALLVIARDKGGPVQLEDREYGSIIGMAIKSLDQIASSVAVRTIDSFLYIEPDLLQAMIEEAGGEAAKRLVKRQEEQREWHSPSDAIQTLEQLISQVEEPSTRIQFSIPAAPSSLRQALIEDLKSVHIILQSLAASGDSFHFVTA